MGIAASRKQQEEYLMGKGIHVVVACNHRPVRGLGMLAVYARLLRKPVWL
jgi:hypothetical protein